MNHLDHFLITVNAGVQTYKSTTNAKTLKGVAYQSLLYSRDSGRRAAAPFDERKLTFW